MTDKIKAVIKVIAEGRNVTAAMLEDGQVDWWEATAYFPVLSQIPAVWNSRKEALEQAINVPDADRAELVAYVKEVLLMPSEAAEAWVGKLLEWIVLTIQLIDGAKAL